MILMVSYKMSLYLFMEDLNIIAGKLDRGTYTDASTTFKNIMCGQEASTNKKSVEEGLIESADDGYIILVLHQT